MRIPSFRTLFRASPMLVVVACASASPPQPPERVIGFLECGTPPTEALAVSVVEPAGDSLSVRGHVFRLNAGSVRGRQRFEVAERRSMHVGVDIQPHGYRFSAPATLTLSYARCAGGLPAGFRPAIVEVRPGSTIPVGLPLPTEVNTEARTVTAHIEHLSGYLIAGT